MGRSKRYKHVELFLRKFVRPSDMVLEIGCGSAPYRDVFARGRYYGTDLFNPHYQEPGDVDIYCTGERLPFRDGSFDVVFSQAAIDYIPDVHAALGEAYRVLRTGGRMLIFTYQMSVLKTIHVGSEQHTDPVLIHRHVFSTAELAAWLERPGFQVALPSMHLCTPNHVLKRLAARLPLVAWYRRRKSPWRVLVATKAAVGAAV